MLPVERFRDERNVGCTTATKDDGVDGNTRGLKPVVRQCWALFDGNREARIWMRRRMTRAGSPVVAAPVNKVLGSLIGHPLPPHIAIIGERDVCEDRVAPERVHRHLVRGVPGSGSDTEEACLRIDSEEAPAFARSQPRDVITDGLGFPTRYGRRDHREVRLATRRWERSRHMEDLADRVGQLENEHVLGQPTFLLAHERTDAQRETLLGQKGVATVARSV